LVHGARERSHVSNNPVDPIILRERLRVGALIRSLREWRNLRQEGLEHLSGVSARQISRMENGSANVGLDAYIQVAHALKVPLASLFVDDWTTTDGGGSGGGEPLM
jgi:DNA-binding XRE family transcriptional regulator